MDSVGFRDITMSCHWAERQKGLAFRIILSFCLITSLCFVGMPCIAADVQPSNPHKKGHLPRLAIFILDSNSKKEADKDLPKAMFDLLTVQLMQKPGIELVERARIAQIMDEYLLTLAQMVNPQKAIQLGKMAGADVTIIARPVKNYRNKAIWIKVINNASGIIKDVAYFPYEKDFADNLKSMAEFVWTASIANINLAQRKFIAVGGFEDQSINDMQINRGDDIRRFLEHKYVGDQKISVVTRSQMRPLLLEMGLNRMGLIAAAHETNSAQPAFIIVDGHYWVIRKSETIYIVKLRIEFLGKRVKEMKIEGVSWDTILKDIGSGIDALLISGE